MEARAMRRVIEIAPADAIVRERRKNDCTARRS
jgi:hypothetical protein